MNGCKPVYDYFTQRNNPSDRKLRKIVTSMEKLFGHKLKKINEQVLFLFFAVSSFENAECTE